MKHAVTSSSREESGLVRLEPRLLAPRRRGERRRAPSLVDVTPGPEERAAIESEAHRSLLVLGEAGHGKTTILVQRVAHLVRRSNGQLRAAVVVPTEGLVRLLTP